MAFLLVRFSKNVNQHHPTPEDEVAHRFDEGDFLETISSLEDTGPTQSKNRWVARGNDPDEYHGHYVTIDVVDMTDEEAEELFQSHPEEHDIDDRIYLRRRGLSLSGMDEAKLREMADTGEIRMNTAQLLPDIVDRAE